MPCELFRGGIHCAADAVGLHRRRIAGQQHCHRFSPLVAQVVGIRGCRTRPAPNAVNELRKSSQADGLTILTMRAGENGSSRNGYQAPARQSIKRPAAWQASALNARYFKEPPNLIGLASDVNEIELSGVGHGPLWFATGPGCLERE